MDGLIRWQQFGVVVVVVGQFLSSLFHLFSLCVVAVLWWSYLYGFEQGIWENKVVWGGCTSVLVVYVLSLSGLLGTWLDAMVHCTAWFTVGMMTSMLLHKLPNEQILQQDNPTA
eukprot:TRINITY_DN29693_c1_g1_i2.p4 TRINITY_DN29693_c1_g1~~TRINITY_DN29693_c1_g1_i2.p4  ORF type:complete len:114 (+),score=10.73 TRINITY_DN29693_c1_g1_i2:3-344(+)